MKKMTKKRRITNIADRCRICLIDHGCMSNIFDESLAPKIEDLIKCTSVDIKDEVGLPKIICHVCLYKLEMWSDFKEQLVQSNELLLNHLDDSEVSQLIKKKKTESEYIPSENFTSLEVPLDEFGSNIMDQDVEINEDGEDDTSTKPSSISVKIKSLSGKRGRTIERRKASTKRWVERKKALLAATGEKASDTDSVVSDDLQLSPLQKARNKTVSENDTTERQKRVVRDLKNLETDGKYSDNNSTQTITVDSSHNYINKTMPSNMILRDRLSKDNDTIPYTRSILKTNNNQNLENVFPPRSVKSKLKIGNITYIATSNLSLIVDSNDIDAQDNLNTITIDDNSEDKNTDIIDAVQLRRVHPSGNPTNFPTHNSVPERCLKVHLDGMGLESLKQIQNDLANYIEHEMKHKLFESNDPVNKRITRESKKNSYSVYQRLKDIIEKSIKKNIEDSMMDMKSQYTVESAIKSKEFQPTVQLERINIEEANQKCKINNVEILKKSDLFDYNSSTGDSEITTMKKNIVEQEVFSDEEHLCIDCGQFFNSRSSIENHMKTHTMENGGMTTSSPPPPPPPPSARQNKPKRMRCSRCHEVVESRLVKMHVCRALKKLPPIHKCYLCNSTFNNDKLLTQHLENHDQSEFQLANTKLDKRSKVKLPTKQQQSVNDKLEIPKSIENSVEPMKIEEKRYSCFICHKIFTDEEVLKDHFAKHCDDMSEDDRSTNKEHHQCQICAESMESDGAFDAHVHKHLFGDEDDNPNLISIGNDGEYQCSQCFQVFKSDTLLEMHMQAHEEEVAIAEWERKGRKCYDFQCIICQDYFQTETELARHIDVHSLNAHVCQLCDKPFISLEELQKHVDTH